jgi:hypothetical protein
MPIEPIFGFELSLDLGVALVLAAVGRRRAVFLAGFDRGRLAGMLQS